MRTEGRGLIHIHSSDRRRLDDRRRLHIAPRLCGFWSAGPPSFRYGQREGAGKVSDAGALERSPKKVLRPKLEHLPLAVGCCGGAMRRRPQIRAALHGGRSRPQPATPVLRCRCHARCCVRQDRSGLPLRSVCADACGGSVPVRRRSSRRCAAAALHRPPITLSLASPTLTLTPPSATLTLTPTAGF